MPHHARRGHADVEGRSLPNPAAARQGGLGVVFVAHDEELNRDVALKEIQDHHAGNEDSRARFVLEAEITGGLEHPGIVPVYGLGQYAAGRPFYAMRFIKGDSLKDAIARFHKTGGAIQDRSVEFRELLERLIDVCNAIQYAHDRGALHRDLKPGNIMLGKYGETLVVDWGLAKSIGAPADPTHKTDEPVLMPASQSGSAATLQGAAIGTPQYMSPEQAAGRLDQLGPASDIYSLGATLYCLLTGKAPIDDSGVDNQKNADLAKVLKKVQTGDFVKPRQLKPELDPGLEAICLKAMALKPEDRYASPSAMVDDLKNWLADEPVGAYPEPWTAQARRWLGKHQTLVTGCVAAVVVGLVSLTTATVMLAQKNDLIQQNNTDLSAANVLIKQQNVELLGANSVIRKQNDDIRLEILEKEKQRKLAESRLRQSLAAVGLFANDARQYCEDALVPGESRRRLFEVQITQLEGQIENEPGEATIDSLRNKLLMYQTLCSVNLDFFQLRRSKEAFDKGMTTVEAWEKLRPGDAPALTFRAALLELNGRALEQQKKLADARQNYAESLAIRRKLVGDPDVDLPSKLQSITALADSLDSLEQFGESLALREKVCQACAKDEKRIQAEEGLKAGRERNFRYREALAWTYQKAGLHANDYAARKKYLIRADKLSDELIQERSTARNVLLRWSFTAKMLGELEYNFGTLAEKAGKMPEAEQYFAIAATYYAKLNDISRKLATSSEMIDGVRDYSRSYYTLGLAEQRKGNMAKARAYYERSRTIREQALRDYANHAMSAHLQFDLFFSQIALGELRDTISQTDNMIFTFRAEPDATYRLACIYALAIATVEEIRKPAPLTAEDKRLQNRLRAEAIRGLQFSHDGGFTDFFQTNIDADLDTLRDDPRMKEFEATHQYRLGLREKKRGDAKKARGHFEKAQKLAEEWLEKEPLDGRYRLIKIDWLCAHVQLGNHSAAVEIADELGPKLGRNKAAHFRLARVYALASAVAGGVKLQEQYRTQAVQALQNAGDYATEHRLASEDDLDPLRDDPRFIKILESAKKSRN
ncbi:MAG: protein kinase [Planctomycetes bacterium]|nr:protein kinase [Planctomycetota bacterium]